MSENAYPPGGPTAAPMTANDVILALGDRRDFLKSVLAQAIPLQAELEMIEKALAAFGVASGSVRGCPYCDHVPFANQRARTRHINKEHPPPPTVIEVVDDYEETP